MRALPDDLRLLITVLLNALVLASAVRFVLRRHIRDWPQVVLDAMLIWYVVQYLSIALPGIAGMLNAGTMTLMACALSAAMIFAPRTCKMSDDASVTISATDRRTIFACLGLLLALIAGHIFNQRLAPPVANDALTYHLPAAAQWLQTSRLGLFETWFFNPANTYSPLAGSTFLAWLIAPMGNDLLARGVETPALVMIFFVLLQLVRAIGASIRIAAIIALAGCCSRPLINQVFLAKDDLFVAAFFGAAVVAMMKPRLQDPLGAIRLGVALGLLFATKYTALLCVPVLLLMIDAPHRAGWRARNYVTAILLALPLAGPWYLRNWIIAGNPVFPIDLPMFAGIFTPARSESLRSVDGVWQVFTNYSGLPPAPLRLMIAIWIASLVLAFKRIKREPIMRIITLGPAIMIVLFIAASPYAEVRFVYPAFLLAFATTAIALSWRGHRATITALAMALAGVMIGTSFIPPSLRLMIEPALYALVVIALIVIAIELRSISFSALLIAGVGVLAFVYWPAYAKQYREGATDYWTAAYGDMAAAWKFVPDDTPSGATIAYANTYFAYPLMGADLDHHIVYAPTRPGVGTIRDLGHVEGSVAGEQIVQRIAELTMRDPDRQTWFENLRARGAKYVFIAKAKAGELEPPELRFVQESGDFRRVFDNRAAAIYELVPAVR